MSHKQFTAKFTRTQSPTGHYPVGSAYERDLQDGRTIAYEIIGFIPYGETTLTVAVEYQRYDKVWGWVGNGHYERLELTFSRGEYDLVSYTEWNGITVKELS